MPSESGINEEIQPENTDRYLRIARNYLSIDANLSESGSVKTGTNYVNKNSDGVSSLASRTHITNSSINYPQGFGILFSKANPYAYIQTQIPSSQVKQYDITIKTSVGDILYVDTNYTNIIIRPKVDLSSTGNTLTNTFQCFVSYIAFKNKTTGKIDHLFECEERTGNILYDAVTGETATLEGVTTLSTLRSNSLNKEWIRDEEVNLPNELCAGGAQLRSTNKLSFKGKQSIAFRLKLNPYTFTSTTHGFNFSEFIYNILATTTTGNGFYINITRGKNVVFGVKTTDASGKQVTVTSGEKSISQYIDNTWYDWVFIIDSENGIMKCYIDSDLIYSVSGNIYTYDEAALVTGIISSRNQSLYDENWRIKDLSIFNIDLSDSNSEYVLSDFANRKPIPVSLLSMSLDQFDAFNAATESGQTVSSDKKTIDCSKFNNSFEYKLYNTTKSTTKVALLPNAWVNWTLRLDAYISDNNKELAEVDYSNFSDYFKCYVFHSALQNIEPTNYSFIKQWKYEVIDEVTGVIEYDSGYITRPESYDTATPWTTYDPTKIFRPKIDYLNAKPKLIKVRVKLDNNFSTSNNESDSLGFFEICPFSKWGADGYFSGTIELVDCYVEGCQASYNNISENRANTQMSSYWLDQTNNGDHLKVNLGNYPSKPEFASKQYGTWLANVGYRNNGNNTYVPRKVNP